MQNKMTNLNNILYEQLEILNDPDTVGDELDQALKKASAISRLAKEVNQNYSNMLGAMKLANEFGLSVQQQKMLGVSNDD